MPPSSSRAELEARVVGSATGSDRDALRRTFDLRLSEYVRRRRDPLASVSVQGNAGTPSGLFTTLATTGSPGEALVLDVTRGPPPGPRWEYLIPISGVRFAADGSAVLNVVGGGLAASAERAVARWMVRERIRVDGSAAAPRPPNEPLPGLLTLPELRQTLRQSPVVPLSIVVLLYLPDRRVRMELDLVDDALEPDIRTGRLPIDRFVPRTARISHGVDAFVARGELSVAAARLLEVLVESHGLTAAEVASMLGGIHEMANTALEVLRARRLATFDSSSGMYRARLDAFLAPGSSARALTEPLPPMATPALRTSVTELLAAADSRATCPLCGAMLPAGPHGILCEKCSAEVGVPDGRSTSP